MYALTIAVLIAAPNATLKCYLPNEFIKNPDGSPRSAPVFNNNSREPDCLLTFDGTRWTGTTKTGTVISMIEKPGKEPTYIISINGTKPPIWWTAKPFPFQGQEDFISRKAFRLSIASTVLIHD